MASVEKQPQQDSTDQKAGPSNALEQSQANASRSMYDEVRQSGERQDEGGSVNANERPSESDNASDKPESASELMLDEIWKSTSETVQSVSKMLSKGISPAIAEKFGALSFFDSNEPGGESGLDAASQQAEQADRVALESKPESNGSESKNLETSASDYGLGEALSDLGDWASKTFNDYVAEPLNDYLNISDIFGSASEWSFDRSDLIPRSQVDEDVRTLNDSARREFGDVEKEITRADKLDLEGATDSGTTDAGSKGLELPGDAYADGSVEIGGSMVTVMRTPGGDTFLKKGEEVIAQQRDDGSYSLALKDGSTLDLKMSRGDDGKYNLDKMERFDADGKLMQKLDDGVFFNYNYDAQGNKTSVNAAADLEGPLSQEKLDKIRTELGDRGAAALRVQNEDGTTKQLLLQSHDSKTHSLTDVDKRNAQIFHEGKEYRLNAADQLALVGADGKEQEVPSEIDEARQKVQEHLKELFKQLGERARGERLEVDGVGVKKNDDGSFDIAMTDPVTGKEEGHIILPADKTDDLRLVKPDGEKANVKREGGLSIDGADGKALIDFDPNSGLKTDQFNLDGSGLKSLEDGSLLKPDGTLTDADGNIISTVGDEESEWWNKPECADCIEQTENSTLSKATTSEVNTLGSISLSISRSGSPAAITVAKSIASEAFGVANAALGALGNDLLNSIPIQLSLSIAQTAFTQAERSERTTTYASRAGISDATRLADLNKIGTLSSTTFSPEEFVRDRMKAA